MTSAVTPAVTPVATDGGAQPVAFYDGGCPLCRREIEHYRRIDTAGRVCWVDITREAQRLRLHALTPEEAMRSFHVLDTNGRWRRGVAGFVELWSHLPYYRRLAALVRVLRLTRPLEFAYRRWAHWRLQRRCSDQHCGR